VENCLRRYVVKLTSLSEENLKAREDIFMEWWRETEGQRLPPPDTLIGVDSLWSKETLFEIEVQCVADL
jgi:enamine deaminase RidA (YjgF/YER057c/UK114 family)